MNIRSVILAVITLIVVIPLVYMSLKDKNYISALSIIVSAGIVLSFYKDGFKKKDQKN
ncbi:hypothetical protein ACW4EZ_31380 (plasmid) [Bacillus toyonensis]|uniref:hypothetical protein n=1 Tax=Bacillus cereus group TaxID=86661 RepID=UPI001298E465|nr:MULTISPECIES: hypothetical protein [Bacillus cereus group]MCC2363998.1 hypothetical protein [Bacillus cereus]MDA2550180.1 hypothetical protein [Bacillus cereus]MDA2555693.1 hypothetical protein [Bacillus cereus]MEB9660269.1 hypothetical protein [Bacillus cereus]MRB36668.1 hypothetical protein [Bacillus thuringiensis]